MYGSHDMRHTGFPRVDGLSTGPLGSGRHYIQASKHVVCVQAMQSEYTALMKKLIGPLLKHLLGLGLLVVNRYIK